MNISSDLLWRQLVKDKTFSDISWLDTPKTFYFGVDCNSADSLTIGNLALLLLAQRLCKSGWKAVIIVGGATSLIGDPGGKSEERPLKAKDEVAQNAEKIKQQLEALFVGLPITIVNNYDWLKDLNYLEFLRDVGKFYSMTELVQREFISERMGKEGGGISYAEFSYTLIQGYDFWYLNKNYDVMLQIGGSDQWGNMLSGVPLIRKKEGTEVHALSMPLVINKATGKKFGKSEQGAIWLDRTKTSPTQFYQFWINVDDESIEDYLKVFTHLTKDEIAEIVAQHNTAPEKRYGQSRLAEEVTTLVHGKDQAELAKSVTLILTNQKTLNEVSDDEIQELKQNIGYIEVRATDSIVNALKNCGLVSSNSEARRLISNKAIYINNQQIDRETFDSADFLNGYLMLRKGKAYKDSALVRLLS